MELRGNPRELWDYLDLLFLHLAKTRRLKLRRSASGREFYDDFFTQGDQHILASDADARIRHRGAILRDIVRSTLPAGGRLIDVGCGIGHNLRVVMRPDVELHGIEYAESSARVAREVLGAAASIRVASATAIPYPDEYFDLAMCVEVLEHVEDDAAAVGEISRILRPGGRLVMSVPYRHWFPSYLRLMGHFRHYTRRDVEDLLSSRGLRVVKHLENFPTWSRLANYCNVACRAYSLALRPFGIRCSPVDANVPFSDRKLLPKLFSWIEPVRRRELGMDYARLATSTFVLAEKRKP